MAKHYLKEGDVFYATGVFIKFNGKDKLWHEKFTVERFEDDSFYNGQYVEDMENSPYIDTEYLPKGDKDHNKKGGIK